MTLRIFTADALNHYKTWVLARTVFPTIADHSDRAA
jgi:hypothetical protein